MSTKIWVDHLEDIARIARAYQDFLTELGQEPENLSELIFTVPEVAIAYEDESTGWSLIAEEGAVFLRVGEAPDDR